MKCIFCDNKNDAKSIEHIVPESFGNNFYTLPKGAVCDDCNSRFSTFEGKALTNSVFAMERARLGVVTKKGKNSKGKVNELIIEGDKNFRKTYLTIKGIDQNNSRNYDSEKRTIQVVVPAFDKSEVATSKLLLSIGLESIYKSQNKIFSKYDFTDMKNYLTTKENQDWPFTTSEYEIGKFKSVPTFYDKYRLKKAHCKLTILEFDDDTLIFQFDFGGISMMINLLNRKLDWFKELIKKDKQAQIYPEHYRTKLGIKEV
ncbi:MULTISPECIES: HNH endonuclease [Flavobacterium]|uniref:HNH endonuclease n=1 Tax=Flavobacterium jumunjinense TaxID=998845 RepID=A0ABV5GKX3_9FLAO|nr:MULTISPECIES: HNH endonuclease [Flavobacterium]